MTSRRQFIQMSFLTLSLPLFFQGKLYASIMPLQTLTVLHEDLFPLTQTLQSNTTLYLVSILNHSYITNDQKQFIRNGVKWLNEESIGFYAKKYPQLTAQERFILLKTISTKRWGERFIFTLLSYIMESVLGDPVYSINHKEQGWKWLEHTTGYPQPKKALV